MNIQIITSSYPAAPHDPSGTAGLFVREFALELARRGHTVVVQPTARKKAYLPDPSLTIEPTPWRGGDRELASISLMNPANWPVICHYLLQGTRTTRRINERYRIERTLCMWVVPSGAFAYLAQRTTSLPYDVWALGSDIWKIRRIPFFGKRLLGVVLRNAAGIFADGLQLSRDVEDISGLPCAFLPSGRKLPAPLKRVFPADDGLSHLLFVGRYHQNKGPDLLIQAVGLLPEDLRERLKVHMFGLGPMEGQLKKMLAELRLEDSIELNGPIEAQEFSDYLGSVSFLVIPSRIESIPVVFSDALQLGTPVVAMPVGDLGDLIRESGCGVVAEQATPLALASALATALAGGKERFQAGTVKAQARFKVENAVSRWLEHGAAHTGSAAARPLQHKETR
jgi:glycosyltransferase involved in cell wall biosynthesis